MHDVAALAGVSRTTASYVINDAPNASIPPDTRQRVWDAVAQLGYRPNAFAQSLRGGKSNVIGFVSDDIATTPFAVDIIRGAQQAALAAGKVLLMMDTDGDAEIERQVFKLLQGWQVDGLIYAAGHHRAVTPVVDLSSVPTVLVDCFIEGGSLPCVVPDEVQGGRVATETLIQAGHRRIGFINGGPDFPASHGRLAGYKAALAAAGIAFDEGLTCVGDWWQESGYHHAHALLKRPEPPTALFCANDWMAMGAYDAIRELGISIPADVAVVGFDNREVIAAHLRPGLTTIALPYFEMGKWAVEFLLAQEKQPVTFPILLECPLVVRHSV